MAKRARRFIWQFVLGLGFLSGIWTAIGLDPEEVLISQLRVLQQIRSSPAPLSGTCSLSCRPSSLLFRLSGHTGREEGSAFSRFLIAYGAGLVILASTVWGLVLLALAAAVGYGAAAKRRKGIV